MIRFVLAGSALFTAACTAIGFGEPSQNAAPPAAELTPPAAELTPPAAELTSAQVEWVVDGDTVDLIIGGQQERVRLIGIDTPETVSREVPVQCFGPEASEALRTLLPVGSEVQIQRDIEARDRFDRLLLYLYRAEDQLFVNQAMIDGGFADTLFFEPNTTFEADFTKRRNSARKNGLGLWSVCDGPDQPLE